MSQPAAMSFNSQTRLLGLDTRHRGITFLCAWVLLMPTLSFAILGDAPAIPVLAAIPLVLLMRKAKPD